MIKQLLKQELPFVEQWTCCQWIVASWI